ncbi:unnamed protein product [Rhodiola kirilowii]
MLEKVSASCSKSKGFVDEMTAVSMKLHPTSEQFPPVAEWVPSLEGYLKFYVDIKIVFQTLESIVEKAAFPAYAEFGNTGLERTSSLAKDLLWFEAQGNVIPEPSSPGVDYALYLEEMVEKDPQRFICHFFNVYFAHSAGGRKIGRTVTQKLSIKKDLEFYKWDGELPELLQSVRKKISQVAEGWTREEKDRCLEETEKSFFYSEAILRLIIS